jgi:uncharacterized membrane protein HdeD (DUF308 family)
VAFTGILTGLMERAIKHALATHWRLFLFQGIVMLVLGILAIGAPLAASVAVELYIGGLFLVSGVMGLVAIMSARDVPAFLWSLLTAAMSIVVGIILINRPIAGTLSLTLVLAAFFLAEGVFQIAASINYRTVVPRSWIWMLLSGVLDLFLAAAIWALWPISAIWTLGLFAGVNLISSGWAAIMAALAGRKLAKEATCTKVVAQ